MTYIGVLNCICADSFDECGICEHAHDSEGTAFYKCDIFGVDVGMKMLRCDACKKLFHTLEEVYLDDI